MIRNNQQSMGGNIRNTPFAINYTDAVTSDTLVELAHNSNSTDGVIGIYGQYNSSGSKYAGMHYDVSTNKWVYFDNVATGPSGNTWTNSLTSNLADIQAGTLTVSGSNIDDPNTVTIGLTGSGADNEITASADLGALISSLIQTNDGVNIKIYSGTYDITTPIILTGYSNVVIQGSGIQNTIIKSSAGTLNDNMIEHDNNAGINKFKCYIRELTLNGNDSGHSNANLIGIYLSRLKDIEIRNVEILNCTEAFNLSSDSLYCNITNLLVQTCNIGIRLFKGTALTDVPNSNNFFNCKLLAEVSGVILECGNNNRFLGCEVEQFTGYGFDIGASIPGAIGNVIHACRIETEESSTAYLRCQATGYNNSINDIYVSGSGWSDYDTNIVDNGSGNRITLSSFKDSKITDSRNQLTAGGFLKYSRTGSGNYSAFGDALITLDDTYTPSGTTVVQQNRVARAASKLYSGLENANEVYYVTGQGDSYFSRNQQLGGTLRVNNADAYESLNVLGDTTIVNDNSSIFFGAYYSGGFKYASSSGTTYGGAIKLGSTGNMELYHSNAETGFNGASISSFKLGLSLQPTGIVIDPVKAIASEAGSCMMYNTSSKELISNNSLVFDTSGNITLTGSLTLPNGGTALNHYQEFSDNYEFTGPWGATQFAGVSMTRTGSQVGITIKAFTGASNSVAGDIVSLTGVPANFRPTALYVPHQTCMVKDDGVSRVGYARIDENGIITISGTSSSGVAQTLNSTTGTGATGLSYDAFLFFTLNTG